jgi:hypothetical protein
VSIGLFSLILATLEHRRNIRTLGEQYSATAMNMAINPNIPRPILYGLLSSGYFLVSSILISVIIYLVH